MVSHLASIAPIKPWGSPPGFRTLPFRLRIVNLRRQARIRIAAAVELTSTPLPIISMEPWGRSSITPQCLEGLVHHGLLRPLTATEECRLPGDEDEPLPPKGYVVSFAHFHEPGFTIPAHQFLRGC